MTFECHSRLSPAGGGGGGDDGDDERDAIAQEWLELLQSSAAPIGQIVWRAPAPPSWKRRRLEMGGPAAAGEGPIIKLEELQLAVLIEDATFNLVAPTGITGDHHQVAGDPGIGGNDTRFVQGTWILAGKTFVGTWATINQHVVAVDFAKAV